MLSMFLALAVAQIAQAGPSAAPPAQDCDAHKFEKIVTAEVDGAPKSSRLRLCGVEGQSDADWLKTLTDAARKLEDNDSLAPAMKEAMVSAVEEEISRVELSKSLDAVTGAAPSVSSVPSVTFPATSPTPLTGQGSAFTLKPRAPIEAPGGGRASDYAALPPLPVQVEGESVAGKAPTPPPPIVRPDLKFQCFSTDDMAEGPCDLLDRYSVVVVSAKAPTAQGTSLLFAVDGKERDEIDISGMRKGQSRRIPIPTEVCRGVSSARLELRTMVIPAKGNFGAQSAGTAGPYILHCQ